MNRDRGTIKWTALMLPEHVKLLREWQAEDAQEERPELEEWMLDELNIRLQQAIVQHIAVTVTYWAEDHTHTLSGKIEQYNIANQRLIFSTGKTLYLHQLLNIELEPTL